MTSANDKYDVDVLGTAPGAELIDCWVFPYDEGVPFSVVLTALLHSVNIDADVSNMNLGAYSPLQEYVDDGR